MSLRVEVKQGTVIGCEAVLPNGQQYGFFKGIPYAKPPVGELRFKAPVRLEKFSAAEIDCTEERAVSYQKDGFTGKIVGSEDCLFLNIYTPQLGQDKLLPVMVYIHGGQFLFGSGNSDLYNPLYLLQEGVVVVTINYRLGVLGFLSLPEANIPGNAGLKDQRMALQWIQENIAKFNGDPTNVTLFGESAGGACTHIHVLSKVSRQFFQKAIIQSGLAIMPWAVDRSPSKHARNFAQSLGCTSEDPLEIFEFLLKITDLDMFIKPFLTDISPEEFLEGRPLPYRPVIEESSPEAVLTTETLESMSVENSLDIPIMMGYNSAEGIVILQAINKMQGFEKCIPQLIPPQLRANLNDQKKAQFAKWIADFYFKGEQIQEKHVESVKDLLSDYFFTVDVNIAAEMHFKKQNTSQLFFYRFDYDGALNIYKKIFKIETLSGASHADELFYIFQAAMAPEPWEENAKKMVLRICRLWANFAKHGNPTPTIDGELIDCIWEPVRHSESGKSLELNAYLVDTHSKMVINPDVAQVNFWKNIKQQLAE